MTAFDRAVEMLRIAARYIRETYPDGHTVHYDGADCDGFCIADDCESAAEDVAALAEIGEMRASLDAAQKRIAELEGVREQMICRHKRQIDRMLRRSAAKGKERA